MHIKNNIQNIKQQGIRKYLLYLGTIAFIIVTTPACEQNPYKQGGILYKAQCANCHGENGDGLRNLIPPIADSDYWKNNKAKIPCLIQHGISGKIIVNGKEYSEAMQGLKNLNAIEITNIIHYIDHTWYQNNNTTETNIRQVEKILKDCE